MKSKILLMLFIFQSTFLFAQKFEWVSSTYSPSSTGGIINNCQVTSDGSGNTYFFGFFDQSIIIGNDTLNAFTGATDLFLTKVDSSGNFIWVKELGGNGFDSPSGICINSQGHLFLAATIQNNDFFSTDTSFTIPGTGSYIISFDTSGNFMWLNQAFTGTGNVQQLKGSKAESSFYYVTNNSIVKTSDNGVTQWTKTATDGNVVFTSLNLNDHGKLAIACKNGGPSTFNLDTVVVSHNASFGCSYSIFYMDSSGSALWGKIVADNTSQSKSIYGIGVSNTDGSVYAGITGNELFYFGNDSAVNLNNQNEFYGAVLKFTSSGNPAWARSIDAQDLYLSDLLISANDEIVFCGRYDNTSYCHFGTINLSPASGDKNMYLCKLSNTGNYVWAKNDSRNGGAGGGTSCEAYYLAELSNGNYVVGGSNSVPVYFGCYFLPQISIGLELFITNISEETEPQAAFTFSANGLTYQFTDQSTGAFSWDWDFGDGTFSTLQNPTHTYSGNGNYIVQLYINDSTCNSQSAATIDSITVDGMNEFILASKQMIVSPNPCDNKVRIYCYNPFEKLNSEINVLTIAGKLLKTITVQSRGDFNLEINTGDLKNGIYLIEAVSDNKILSVTKLSVVR